MWTGCRGSTRESECSNRISDANFLIVFHTNYGSILRSFQDMTDDGPTTATKQPTITYLALKAWYTLETKLKADKVHRACHYDPIHNYKVDGIGYKVHRNKLSNLRCCRFVAKTGNKVERICNKVKQSTLLPIFCRF